MTASPKSFGRLNSEGRIIAFSNRKGGVGKTTSTINIGACLGVQGYRVLIIDLDPQRNATSGLNNFEKGPESIYDALLGSTTLAELEWTTNYENLYLIPSSDKLADAEVELVSEYAREYKLKNLITTISDQYDFVLIDCPPSFGLLNVNALVAATEVIVPVQCQYLALEGVAAFEKNIIQIKDQLNPGLPMPTFILTMYDARTNLSSEVVSDVRHRYGEKVYKTVIPHNVKLAEAPSVGKPIIVLDPSSSGAKAYTALTKEISGGPPQRTR